MSEEEGESGIHFLPLPVFKGIGCGSRIELFLYEASEQHYRYRNVGIKRKLLQIAKVKGVLALKENEWPISANRMCFSKVQGLATEF